MVAEKNVNRIWVGFTKFFVWSGQGSWCARIKQTIQTPGDFVRLNLEKWQIKALSDFWDHGEIAEINCKARFSGVVPPPQLI